MMDCWRFRDSGIICRIDYDDDDEDETMPLRMELGALGVGVPINMVLLT